MTRAAPRSRWPPLIASLLIAALVISPAAIGDTAEAKPAYEGRLGQLDRSIAYLQAAQNRDGGFGGRPGGESDPIFSAWVGIGLAAAGINPRDQVWRRGETSLYTYLTRHADELEVTTDFERAMLVAVAAGASPYRFGDRNLVDTLLSRQLPDGSFPHQAGGKSGGVNDTAFAILPLSTQAEPRVRAAIVRAAGWLISVQEADGSWGFAPGVGSSSDMTAAVIQALRAARIESGEAEARGWEYIRRTQTGEGGFSERPGETEPNTASTAWVAQAMWAAGIAPEAWRTPQGGDPLTYLASMQREDGSIRWRESQDLNPIWMTAYAAPAFAGHPLPVPAVPRSKEGETREGEVGAGGGGRGAPLFSRPQPGSRGEATGGIRRIRGDDHERHTRSRDRTRSNTSAPPTTSQSSGDGSFGVTATPSPAGSEITLQPTSPTGRQPGSSEPPPRQQRPRPREGKGSGDVGAGTVTGYVIDPSQLGLGNDGEGERDAAAPGLAGRTDDPGHTGVIMLVGGLFTALAIGAFIEFWPLASFLMRGGS